MIKKLPLKLILTGLVLIISLSTVYAQVSLREITLKEQLDNSSLVVEGQVISQKSFYGEEDKIIYTSYTVNVYKVFKGKLVNQIEVVTIGGSVGFKTLLVSHGLKLGKGSVGVFMLYDSNFNLGSRNTTKNKQFKTYSGVQGFYAYNINDDVAINPFSKRKEIESTLYKDITDITKTAYKKVAPFNIKKLQEKTTKNNSLRPPSRITFSPTTITAGTGSVLIIQGSGFGTEQGKVGFRDSDSSGFPFFDALDSQVLSWDDDLITVEVPVISTTDDSVAGTAGTGNIRVTDSNGVSNTSNAILTISSAQINVPFDPGTGVEAFETQHYDDNGSGGYTWVMEDDFSNGIPYSDAPASFLRAFESWRCETKVNWEVSGASTSTTDIGTEENIIAFDVDGTSSELPAGVLGTCFTSLSGTSCNSGIIIYVTDLDIVFDRETSWYFGTDPLGIVNTNRVDFETVALHELGHGHQLGHVINSSNVMHFQISSEIINSDLDVNSIAAANDVHSRSTTVQTGCFPFDSMTDYSGSCGLSVQNNTLENTILMYPNPAKQEFYIKSTVVALDEVEIYDVRGRLISQIDISDSSRKIAVNITSMSKGVYFVNIHSEGKFSTKKLIIE